jgi:hypothetical protein
MPGIQTTQSAEVFVDYDRVVLKMGKFQATIPYAIAFKIAQGIRVSAKHIQRINHVSETWTEIAEDPNLEPRTYVERGRKPIRPKAWAVNLSGETVVLVFDDVRAEMHFSDALRISQWLRIAGRQCKRNVGDSTRHMNAAGMLTDAALNR